MRLKVVAEEKSLDSLLNELSKKANEVSELKKRIESIINLLSERYSKNESSVVKNLFNSFIKSHTPPPPPAIQSASLSLERNLEEYSAKLKNYLDLLARYARGLEECLEAEKNLKRLLSKIEENLPIIEKIDPSIHSSIVKVRHKALRTLQNPSVPDPYALADELKKYTRELKCLIHRFEQNYKRKLTEITEMCDAALKLYYQVKPLVTFDKAEIAKENFEKIKSIKSKVIKAVSGLAQGKYSEEVLGLENEVRKTIEIYEKILGEESSKDYAKVLSVLSLMSKSSRTIPFHTLIDEISRSTGMSQEEVIKMLVYLSRKHAVKIRVKVEV